MGHRQPLVQLRWRLKMPTQFATAAVPPLVLVPAAVADVVMLRLAGEAGLEGLLVAAAVLLQRQLAALLPGLR
jgi:hypothetical protein